MKKTLVIFLSLFLLISCFIPTQAVNNSEKSDENTVIEYFCDGSYITTTIIESTNSINRSTSTKTGTKTITYSDANGDTLWEAFLHGTFTYNGTTSSCTSTNITYSVYDSDWKITSATSTKSGNKAIGNITAKRYFIGIPTATIDKSATLTCSANGTLS